MIEKPTLIFDGLNVFFRHYVANPSMNENGESTGGVVGFLRNIQHLCERYNPADVIIAWEGGGSSRKRARDPHYKSGRKPVRLNRFYEDEIPDTQHNRNLQVAWLVSLLKKSPITQVYVSDCEGDDVVAYITNKKKKSANKIIVISSDRDLYQLIDDDVHQWSPGQKKLIKSNDVLEKFNIHPTNFCTARCFIGDKSDDITGVKGAGFKTLARRFPSLSKPDFVSVNDILTKSSTLQEQSTLKIYDEINQSADKVRKNWKLMYLGHQNLAASQMLKIDSILDLAEKKRDKLGFIRQLMKLGINNFDFDRFFASMKALT